MTREVLDITTPPGWVLMRLDYTDPRWEVLPKGNLPWTCSITRQSDRFLSTGTGNTPQAAFDAAKEGTALAPVMHRR